jgi:hypothetical protein
VKAWGASRTPTRILGSRVRFGGRRHPSRRSSKVSGYCTPLYGSF